MVIDKYKLTLTRFTCELSGGLDSNKRIIVQTEAEIYEVAHPDNCDGTFDEVYRSKVVGATEIKQFGKKPLVVKGKSKRSLSQQLRIAFMAISPEEEFYQQNMP